MGEIVRRFAWNGGGSGSGGFTCMDCVYVQDSTAQHSIVCMYLPVYRTSQLSFEPMSFCSPLFTYSLTYLRYGTVRCGTVHADLVVGYP